MKTSLINIVCHSNMHHYAKYETISTNYARRSTTSGHDVFLCVIDGHDLFIATG